MSTSLLIEIRDAAVSSDMPISTLLRKCAVLASILNNAELEAWTSRELNGYPPDAPVPNYRILSAPARGDLVGPFNEALNGITIPVSMLPESARKFAEQVALPHPIAELEYLSRRDETKGTISCPWPGDLIAHMQSRVVQGMTLISAEQSIPVARLIGIVDTVRNRVLAFAIQLHREAPNVGSSDTSSTRGAVVSNERVTQIFNMMVINGGVTGPVTSGSVGTIHSTIHVGDLATLRSTLAGHGVPATQLADLEQALGDDRAAGQEQLGPETTRWIDRFSTAVTSGTLKLAGGVTTGVIVKAILQYLGVG